MTNVEETVKRIETRFSELEKGFANGTIPMVDLNRESTNLLFEYQQTKKGLIRLPFGKAKKKEYDKRVYDAYDKMRDNLEETEQ